MAICNWCKGEMLEVDDCSANRTVEYPDGETLESIPYSGEDRCHDCNVAPGGYHHPGCDMEECPRCGGQLFSCFCLDEPDDEPMAEDAAEVLAELERMESDLRVDLEQDARLLKEAAETAEGFVTLEELDIELGPCFWDYDGKSLSMGVYKTACDNAFCLNDGTPAENGMVFCPYCGRKIVEAREDEKI